MSDLAPARPDWVPSELYPFEDRWATIDGNLVHYIDEGDGPPILFLNGNPSWSFGWRDVILALRDRFRCIAPDYPGFGLSRPAPGYDFRPRSHAAVIEALVDRLGLTELTVYGYAWGGPIGLGLAGRRPELIRALVIGNTWAWPDDRLRARLFAALMGGPLGPATGRSAEPDAAAVPAAEPETGAPHRCGTSAPTRALGRLVRDARCACSRARSSPADAYLREVEARLPRLTA